MAIRKEDTPLVNPPTAVFLGGLAIILGFVIGVADRARFPAEAVREMPPAEDRTTGRFYYIEGSQRSVGNLAEMRARFLDGGAPLSIAEGDANVWLRQHFSPEMVAEDDVGWFHAQMGAPNLKMDTAGLQLAVPFDAHVFGRETAVVYVASGTLEGDGGDIRFRPQTTSVGSAPIPAFLGRPLYLMMRRMYRDNETFLEMEHAFGQYSGAVVDEQSITLTR